MRYLLFALACRTLVACTAPPNDTGPSALTRNVDDSGQNRWLSFDGVNDYATTATAEFPDGHAAQTISAWFKLDSIAGTQALVTVRKDFDSGLELAVADGLLSAIRVYGTRTLAAATKPVSAGAWHFAAYTFDGASNQLYVDGARVASSADLPDKRTPTSCWLGTLDGTRDLLHGSLDDVRVLELVRTPEELMNEAADHFSSADPGLVLDLPFDESEGSTVYDRSSYANDGQLGDGVEERMPARVSASVEEPQH
ncbi:MAG TPA: LamG domain-containing protein [Polyangiaceae bacterium]